MRERKLEHRVKPLAERSAASLLMSAASSIQHNIEPVRIGTCWLFYWLLYCVEWTVYMGGRRYFLRSQELAAQPRPGNCLAANFKKYTSFRLLFFKQTFPNAFFHKTSNNAQENFCSLSVSFRGCKMRKFGHVLISAFAFLHFLSWLFNT